MQEAALKQEKAYNNRMNYPMYTIGDPVFLKVKVKGSSPKESFPKWEGPYVIVEKLSEVVYVIQRLRNGKQLVVNVDRLKKANTRKPVDTSWLSQGHVRPKLVGSEEAERLLNQQITETSRYPKRNRHPPNRY